MRALYTGVSSFYINKHYLLLVLKNLQRLQLEVTQVVCVKFCLSLIH